MTNLQNILTAISNDFTTIGTIINYTGLTPTQISEAVRPAIKSGDLIKTGKGKTSEYTLPVEEKIVEGRENGVMGDNAPTVTFTDAEINMLAAFYQTSTDCCGACNDEENMSYMNADDLQDELGLSKQAIGGLMSSLSDKNAIVDTLESARNAKVNDWVIQSYIAESFANTLENHVVIKSKTKKVKATKTEADVDVTTLKSICEGLNIETTFARRKLRKANVTKPGTGWNFPKGTDIDAIIKIIK